MTRQTSKIPLLTKINHKNSSISKMNHMQKKIHSASTYNDPRQKSSQANTSPKKSQHKHDSKMRKPTLSTREPTQLNEKEENRRSTVLSPGNFPRALQDIKKSRKKLKTFSFPPPTKKNLKNKKKTPKKTKNKNTQFTNRCCFFQKT